MKLVGIVEMTREDRNKFWQILELYNFVIRQMSNKRNNCAKKEKIATLLNDAICCT